MPAENEKIFVREVKNGYLATYNGVKGKGKTMFKAIERAKKNYSWEQENIDIVDALEYGVAAYLGRGQDNDITRSID